MDTIPVLDIRHVGQRRWPAVLADALGGIPTVIVQGDRPAAVVSPIARLGVADLTAAHPPQRVLFRQVSRGGLLRILPDVVSGTVFKVTRDDMPAALLVPFPLAVQFGIVDEVSVGHLVAE